MTLIAAIMLFDSCGNDNKKASSKDQTESVENGEDGDEETPLGMFAEEDYRPQFEYDILLDASKTEVMGKKFNPFQAYDGELAIKELHPVFGDEYLYFEDEMNYNEYIHEWILASYLSILMVEDYSSDWESNKDKVVHALSFVGDLPNTSNIEDPEIAEKFRKAYYDLRSLDIFMPRERYGIKEYLIGNNDEGVSILRSDGWIKRYHYATVRRLTGNEALGVDDGILGIGLNQRSNLEIMESLGL